MNWNKIGIEILTWTIAIPAAIGIMMLIGMGIEKQTTHNELVRDCQKAAKTYYEGTQC